MRNLALVFDPARFEPAAFRNGARYLKSKTTLVSVDDSPKSSPNLLQVGPRTPENRPEVSVPLNWTA